MVKPEKIYKCKYCDCTFIVRQALAAHILSVHKQQKYICKICGKTVSGKYNYNKHIELYHTPYYCEKCGKLVLTKYGCGRFCSRKCSNTRIISTIQKKQISAGLVKWYKLKKKPQNKCIDCGVIISPYAKRCIKCNALCEETRIKLSQSHRHPTFLTKSEPNTLFYGYIYFIENLLDKSVYVGQHFTKLGHRKNNYFGSGVYLKRAIKKYGKHNFKKTILFEGPCTQIQLNELEQYYIWLAKNNNSNVNCYNIAKGGRGNTQRI